MKKNNSFILAFCLPFFTFAAVLFTNRLRHQLRTINTKLRKWYIYQNCLPI